MAHLDQVLLQWAQTYRSRPGAAAKVVVSPSTTPGEGEHKILKALFRRYQRQHKSGQEQQCQCSGHGSSEEASLLISPDSDMVLASPSDL